LYIWVKGRSDSLLRLRSVGGGLRRNMRQEDRAEMAARYARNIAVCVGVVLSLSVLAPATALAANGAASAPAASGMSATARVRAGWHIVAGLTNCAQTPLKMATTGPDAAWVMGAGLSQTDGCAADGIDVDYWNGGSWSLLPATAALPGQTGSNGAIAASSTQNVWVFPVLAGPGTSVYATTENWNGTSWIAVPLPVNMLVSSAVAFSASDAWASGLTERGRSILVRFTGSSWHRASLPGEPVQVSALSASDMWAVGPSAKTAARPVTKHAIVAMHWTGRKWRTLATPRIRLPR
jgi:hypothetical protein